MIALVEGVEPMNWIEGMREAIAYIEANLTEPLDIDEIAKKAYVSTFYFQKAFSLLCGFTVGEYVRQRRLACAGSDLVSSDERIIDIALRYGYDSPDSFTKAFSRFHGSTPTAVRRNGATIKSFAPLKLKFILEGGYLMDYKIVEKEAFTVIGSSKRFNMEDGGTMIPKFWTEHFASGMGKTICGMYGICVDQNTGAKDFEYLIADKYEAGREVPPGLKTLVIPKHTWAVFPCRGPMPTALQEINKKIFSEWLPNCKDYEITGDYNIEGYDNVLDYPLGNQDPNYYTEIWIPIRKKSLRVD
jgi:AraC family transcriptional regulator